MKLYVANRAEIARRVIKTAKRLGVETCVGYSEVDKDLPFVREADFSKCLSVQDPRDAYLNIDVVKQAATEMGATHIHPGYGFLSENPEFVDQIEQEFVGPSSESMRLLGDKIGSRRFLSKMNIPLLPAYDGDDQSSERLKKEAEKIGYPLLIKPSAGGGGKGMLRVFAADELEDAINSSKRIAKASFNDDRVFLERYVETARHIEIQILADKQGNVISVGERECSIQRRHQKLIEETPCAVLPAPLRKKLSELSCKIAQAVNYFSAGTMEWIWDGAEGIYFLEMNTRLQVEHPVTELCHDIDLVEWQIRISKGESVSNLQVESKGHAMEARLCAEDPSKDFMPTGGKIFRLRLPEPEEARVDFGFFQGNEVSAHFDSMLGKIICWGSTREESRKRLIAALERTVILGPQTNRSYLIQILKSEAFAAVDINTKLLEKMPYRFDQLRALKAIQELKHKSAEIETDSEEFEDLDVFSPWGPELRQKNTEAFWEERSGYRYFHFSFADWSEKKKLLRADGLREEESSEDDFKIKTPMPSKLISLNVKEGESVKKGQVLAVVEAMKMEHQLKAPADAKVLSVNAKLGEQLPPDEVILEMEPHV